MDKFQALQTFWSSFGIDAYDESTVPTGDFRPELPYITYSVEVSDFYRPVYLNASIWYYGASWSAITTKLSEVSSAIGLGGKILPVDGGGLWIKRGFPFAQRMSDPDDMVRRIYLNIEAEFITA